MTASARRLTQSYLPPHLLRSRLHGLYVITDERIGGGHLAIARAALAGGANIIQLRDKSASVVQLLPLAHELRRMTRAAGALFFVNDKIDMALAVGADGVHLGPDDMPLAEARRLLGPHRLLGTSCSNVTEVQTATRTGADYIGAGAIFGTATKHDAGPAIGLNQLHAMAKSTNLPIAAIGGVNEANIVSTIEAGANMACVVSAIALAGDHAAMLAATRNLIQAARF